MTDVKPGLAPGEAGFWRQRHLAVHALSLVLTAVWVAAVFMVGSFLTVASPVGGWLYAALCFLPGLVGTARLGGVRRWRDVLALAGAASLLLGFLMYQQAPPDHGRIRSVAEDVGVPVDGWRLVDESERGDTWCWKGCPEVSYTYLADESPAETVDTLGARLEGAGWSGGAEPAQTGENPSEYDPLARATWRRGRWAVQLTVPPPAARSGWSDVESGGPATPVQLSFDGGGH